MLAPLGKGEANGGREMGGFVYGDCGGLSSNKGECMRGKGRETQYNIESEVSLSQAHLPLYDTINMSTSNVLLV